MPAAAAQDLVLHLYDAAADSRLWAGMATRIAAAFQSTSAVVKLHGDAARVDLLECTPNMMVPDGLRSWAEHWHRQDLWVERSVAFGMSRIVTSGDLVSTAEQTGTAYYQEWLRYLDIHHMVGAVFPAGDGAIGVLGIHRPSGAGAYSEADRQDVSLFLPHLQRALQLSRQLARAGLLAEAGLDVLDRLDTGVLALDQSGRILHANAMAESILRDGIGLGVVGNRLAARHKAIQEQLSAALRTATETASGRPGRAPSALAIPRDGRLPLTLSLAPLPPSATRARPLVLVFLRDPERPALQLDRLRELFGLTPTEAAIAASLGAGRSLEEIAAALSIGLGTVRWHVKRILAKSGTHRQAEAAALFARSVAALPARN